MKAPLLRTFDGETPTDMLWSCIDTRDIIKVGEIGTFSTSHAATIYCLRDGEWVRCDDLTLRVYGFEGEEYSGHQIRELFDDEIIVDLSRHAEHSLVEKGEGTPARKPANAPHLWAAFAMNPDLNPEDLL